MTPPGPLPGSKIASPYRADSDQWTDKKAAPAGMHASCMGPKNTAFFCMENKKDPVL
jgi:hypothetical protein